MALIPCSKCGKQISSLAAKCPHCGEMVNQTEPNNSVVCPECATRFGKNVEACPNCGEPNKMIHSTTIEQHSTIIDYEKIFNVVDDEFEETKMIMADYDFWGNEEMDSLGDELGAISPNVSVAHFTDKEGGRFLLIYDERDLLHEINDAELGDQYPQIGSPIKGMFIILDDSEKIKLNVTEENDGRSWFEIDESQFLKCCNAHSILFKVFRTNGDSITVTDTNEDSAPAVDGFRAMYHFVKDRSLYKDSVLRIQHWADKLSAETEKIKRENEHRQAEMEQKELDKGNRNVTIGVILAVIGVILFIVGVTDFDDLFWLVIIGLIAVLVSAAFIIFGVMKKRGYDDVAALNKVTEILGKINIR